MYYKKKEYSKKVKKRILRHKRIRYHNDAYLFDYENSRRNKKSYRNRIVDRSEDINETLLPRLRNN